VHSCVRVRCDACVCGVGLSSLRGNKIRSAGATAISHGLASVPQLRMLEYVIDAVCGM
jgi:hypothetical protein